ncbi:heme lyase NrfEFG subunit NrfF [Shewanella maritima]|uniref:heme lyase NrfEFG subunit NrfF n=1 Tax=Shewanella maritima TaxID=2520507 RepID=UPI0037363FFB
MKAFKLLIVACFSMVLSVSALADSNDNVDTYQFKSDNNQKRALSLSHNLRCPQCQNQNLIDSNSPVADDLRLEVYKMVDEGRTDNEIIDFMTSRYGDFVLYKPRLDPKTYILWGGPFALLAIGLFVGLFWVRRQKTAVDDNSDLTDDEQKQLDELLNRK